MREEILKITTEEYQKLERLVKNYKGTLKKLCKELTGFNYDKDEQFFDVNYGQHLNTTVYYDKDIGLYLSDMITVWDDGDGTTTPASEDFYICQDCGALIPAEGLITPDPTIGCLCEKCLNRFDILKNRKIERLLWK